ncbi:MAG: hypothetical protein R3E76_00655 [Planctomycetota bacterium]
MKLSSLITLTVLTACVVGLSACGAGGNPPGTSPGGTATVVVAVSPKVITIQLGTQRQFSATASDGMGVSWSVSPAGGFYGSIDSAGLYTAPATMPGGTMLTIRATSVSDPLQFDDASVQLTPGPVFGSFPITFEVRTRSAWAANLAPTTVGIPMPRMLHSNVNTLRLEKTAGAVPVPAQFRVTSRWGDNSIRWVMVDFIADLSGTGGVGNYQLNNGGTGSATGTNLSVTNGANSIDVSTGTLKFTVNKNSFQLFDSIQIDRDGDTQVDDECLDTAALKGIVVTEGANEFLMSQSTPLRVTVEEQGPIRTTIVAEGAHRNTGLAQNKLNYVVRITAWNDLSFIKVDYSFKNMTGDGVPAATQNDAWMQVSQHEDVDSIIVDLPLEFNASLVSARIGGNPGDHTKSPITTGAYYSLTQAYSGTHDATDTANPQPPSSANGSSDTLTDAWPTQNDTFIDYTLDDNGGTTTSSAHAPGWMQMAGTNLRATVALQEFWQLYPKELRAQQDGLMRVGIWPASAPKLQVFAGAMKTHTLMYGFSSLSSLNTTVAEVQANLVSDPPRGYCDSRHYAASGVFGNIASTNTLLNDTSAFRPASQTFALNYMTEVLDHRGDILFDRTDGNGSAIGHAFGMWNFGDSKIDAPTESWENGAWGASHAAFQWFAMSGNTEFLYLAETTARHFRDVVVQHSDIGTRFDYTESGNPAVSGGKASQLGKTRYTPNNKQHDLGNYHDGENHLDVFSGAALAYHWLLTGDALSLQVLGECYTYLRATWKRFFDAGNGGTDSTMTCPTTWLSNALLVAVAYEMANGLVDSSAAGMTDYVFNAISTRQTTVTTRDPNGVGFADNSGNFKAWEIGHLMEALEYFRWLRTSTGVDAMIEAGMNWLLGTNADVYLGNLTVPQFGAFAETSGGTTDFGGPNLMIGAGYVGAFRNSGGANWKTAADNLVNVQTGNIENTTIGDANVNLTNFAQYFRAGPLLLATLKP